MGICNTNDSINDNPKLLKQLLREWLLIIPTNLYLFNTNPSDSHCIPNTTPTTDTLAAFAINNNDNNNIIQYKIIVMMYYETLSKVLDNFSPKHYFIIYIHLDHVLLDQLNLQNWILKNTFD